MDFSTLIPIIIFFYIVSTIFNTDSKKKNKKPSNYQGSGTRPQGSKPQSQRETKTSGSPWRDMFEELEREFFPKEETKKELPSSPRDNSYQSPTMGYNQEGLGGYEGAYGGSTVKVDVPLEPTPSVSISRPELSPSEKRREVSSHSTDFIPSTNPIVQGVIWAEVLGKPRSQNPWNLRGK